MWNIFSSQRRELAREMAYVLIKKTVSQCTANPSKRYQSCNWQKVASLSPSQQFHVVTKKWLDSWSAEWYKENNFKIDRQRKLNLAQDILNNWRR